MEWILLKTFHHGNGSCSCIKWINASLIFVDSNSVKKALKNKELKKTLKSLNCRQQTCPFKGEQQGIKQHFTLQTKMFVPLKSIKEHNFHRLKRKINLLSCNSQTHSLPVWLLEDWRHWPSTPQASAGLHPYRWCDEDRGREDKGCMEGEGRGPHLAIWRLGWKP